VKNVLPTKLTEGEEVWGVVLNFLVPNFVQFIARERGSGGTVSTGGSG